MNGKFQTSKDLDVLKQLLLRLGIAARQNLQKGVARLMQIPSR